MKRIILALLAASCMLPVFSKTPHGPSNISVISYNIRMGEGKDGTNSWQFRCPATILMLNEEKPDIFGVQEAYDYQMLFITENCRQYKAFGVGREDGKSKGEHTAIFYNKKNIALLSKGNFWLSETPEKPSVGWDAACPRTATWALMKDKRSGKKFYFVNTHLDHMGETARKEGLRLIMDSIGEINTKGYPVILTGDFNITPDDKALKVLNERMKSCRLFAIESDQAGTYHGWGRESEPIDYIYFNGFRECGKFKVITKKYAGIPFISDHYPIKAVLTF